VRRPSKEKIMSKQKYKVSVPGSLMLFGEHAVLHGSSAIVAAIDKRITVELNPRSDSVVHVFSALGEVKFNLAELKDLSLAKPWEYVLAIFKSQQLKNKLPSGFDLQITSEFAADLGFGSSAAVAVAILAALHCWINGHEADDKELLLQAREIIRKVQGVGSGADAAASIFGGIVLYNMSPLKIEKIAATLPLSVVYSGSKKATKEVIAEVALLQDKHPQLFHELYAAMNICVSQGTEFIKQQNWRALGEIMNIHHGLQVALGTSNLLLEELVFVMREQPGVFGAKISGSGLGDCVICCGALPENHFPNHAKQRKLGIKQLPINVCDNGICYF
jgi:mevalonate kinase